MSDKLYAEIIVDNKSSNTDKLFTYIIPKMYREKLKKGMRVLVPFGFGNKLIEGIVINVKKNIDNAFNPNLLKYIDSMVDEKPVLSESMLELGQWMKEFYLAQYIDVYRTILPTGLTTKVKKYVKLIKPIGEISMEKNSSKNIIKIINYLNNNKEVEVKILKDSTRISNIQKHLETLQEQSIIEVYDRITSETNKKYERYVIRNYDISETNKVLKSIGSRAYKQGDVIKLLYNIEQISLKDILVRLNTSYSTIKSIEEKGFIKLIDKEVKRSPISSRIDKYDKIQLTSEQKKCYDSILQDMNNGKRKFLIHGVTGSGKTEVYLQLIESVLKENKQAIVLVPEISLTPQTVERFVGRFGDNVAILHSRLSLGERYDEWRRINEGEVNIVVGARSAIFAPFNRLGLIIIDEEHESSYKSSMNPKYNTIEVAEKRVDVEDCSLVLGSATPSIETYYKSLNKEIILLNLPNRVNNKQLPPIEVIDMKKELENGNKSIFSLALYTSIKENIASGKQTILFLNRRGFSTFVSCRECGYVAKCNECDISLTFHADNNILKCHYCGLATKPPQYCPQCNSKYIKYFGIGTQKVEKLVKELFPSAKIARMDVDTTSKKGSHERILNRVKKGEVDILIGTQMISKGLDFPNVTLVGIIAADLSLNLPDFKASERTFQLLTQVGGRAGRGEVEGKVVLQTYEPDHYSIVAAQSHDYINFYNKEIQIRKEFMYPPYTNIINLVFVGKLEDKISKGSKIIYNRILDEFSKVRLHKFTITEPNPAIISKIKNQYRWQLLIKAHDDDINTIKKVLKRVCIEDKDQLTNDDVKISIDINPSSII